MGWRRQDGKAGAEGTGGLLAPGPGNHWKVFALMPSEAGAIGGFSAGERHGLTSVFVIFL